MKKILALVLAVALVLGLATTAFAAVAADGKVGFLTSPTGSVIKEDGENMFKKDKFVVVMDITNGSIIYAEAVGTTAAKTVPIAYTALFAGSVIAVDNLGQRFTGTQIGYINNRVYIEYTYDGNLPGGVAGFKDTATSMAVSFEATFNTGALVGDPLTAIFGACPTDADLPGTWAWVPGNIIENKLAFTQQIFTRTVAPSTKVDPEIARAVLQAIATNNSVATIDVNRLSSGNDIDVADYMKTHTLADLTALVNGLKGTFDNLVTANDWYFITNTWKNPEWYPNYSYLGLSLKFVNNTTKTWYYIDESAFDYKWSSPMLLTETDGLRVYTGQTDTSMYNMIRGLTGDTKNPYVFGWAMLDELKANAVPTMTISKVIPQQWINYYGHRALYLFGWDAGINCNNPAHDSPDIIKDYTLDAVTTTQRIEFTTDQLYKTLVLAAKSPEAAKPADDKTDDANPNTGANDIVNVAIVFAVVSLAAAGAFVFKKAK